MRVLLALLFAFCAHGCTTPSAVELPASEPGLDHLNPVMLNEYAAACIRDGDIDTAWILLERAALLAPHDERIAANLAVVRAWRAGKAQ